jgi:hypothetical protein
MGATRQVQSLHVDYSRRLDNFQATACHAPSLLCSVARLHNHVFQNPRCAAETRASFIASKYQHGLISCHHFLSQSLHYLQHAVNVPLPDASIRDLIGGSCCRRAKNIAGRVRKFPKRELQVHHNPTIPLTHHNHVSLDTQRPKCGPLQERIPKVRPAVP